MVACVVAEADSTELNQPLALRLRQLAKGAEPDAADARFLPLASLKHG
jgi:hypothetical protein